MSLSNVFLLVNILLKLFLDSSVENVFSISSFLSIEASTASLISLSKSSSVIEIPSNSARVSRAYVVVRRSVADCFASS